MRSQSAPSRLRQAAVAAAACAVGVFFACTGQSTFQQPASGDTSVPSDGSGGVWDPGTPPPPFVPAPAHMRRLLSWQYSNALHDLLGAEAANAVTAPQDSAVNGFDAIGAAQLSVSTQAIEQVETSSYTAVELALSNAAMHQTLVPCSAKAVDDAACLQQVITAFGHRAWRRPLTSSETSTWVSVGQKAGQAYGSFDKAVEFALAGMLQSPNFLYLSELGEPDPQNGSRLRLTSLEMGARLAFFLTGTLPDAELLAAAESGALVNADAIRAQAQRLVNKPEAKAALKRFFDEAFQLRDVPSLPKDPAMYPDFSPALAQSMATETQLLIDDIVWNQDGDFRDVLDAPYTFVDKNLAGLYGISKAPSSGFARVQLDASQGRAGFLGNASFLSLMAHPRSTSPTRRGKFIRERLLCGNVPAPPPNVNTVLVDSPSTSSMTMRERLAAHLSNASCAGCHHLMDDVGLGLENFDGIGRYRTTDNGKPIDASAQLDANGAFVGPAQLGKLLKDDPRVTSCLVRNVFRAASGHVDTLGEVAPLKAAEEAFVSNGYRMKSLLVELAASDAFRFASAEEVSP